MKNYQLTYKILPLLIETAHKDLMAYTSMTKEEAIIDLISIYNMFPYAKVFELDNDITTMLYHTKNKVRPTKLPFPITWLETELKLYNIWTRTPLGLRKMPWVKYHGFLIYEGLPVKESMLKGEKLIVLESNVLIEQNYPNIYIFSVYEDETGMGHIKFSLYKEYEDLIASKKELRLWAKERNQLRQFIMSFLDFLYNPEVQIVEVLRSAKTQEKRIRKGKLPLPEIRRVIRVTGVLKQYINRLREGRHFHYSHRFWVRGHWRHFRHSRYVNLRGKRVWIPPFIKGSGILINKSYKLVDRRQYTPDYYRKMLTGKEV